MIPRIRRPPENPRKSTPVKTNPVKPWRHCSQDVPCNGTRGCACGDEVRAELREQGEETDR